MVEVHILEPCQLSAFFRQSTSFLCFLVFFSGRTSSFSGIWMLNNFLIWSLCIQFLSFSRCNPHIYKVLLPQEKRWCMHARYKYPMRFLLDFVCDCGNCSQRLLIGSGDLQAHRRDSTPARPFRWTHQKVAGFTPALFGPFMLPKCIYIICVHTASLFSSIRSHLMFLSYFNAYCVPYFLSLFWFVHQCWHNQLFVRTPPSRFISSVLVHRLTPPTAPKASLLVVLSSCAPAVSQCAKASRLLPRRIILHFVVNFSLLVPLGRPVTLHETPDVLWRL